MSRHAFLVGIAIITIALAFLLTDHLLNPPGGISLRTARHIRLGMTVAKVEAVFGRAADETDQLFPLMRWRGEHGEAMITFDADNRVDSLRFLSPTGECRLRLSRMSPSSTGPIELLDLLVPATPAAPSFPDWLHP